MNPTQPGDAPTPRQLEVLALVAKGLSYRDISAALGAGPGSAATLATGHLKALVAKGLVEVTGKASHARHVPTAAGWALLGLEDCGNCNGTGKVQTTTKARI